MVRKILSLIPLLSLLLVFLVIPEITLAQNSKTSSSPSPVPTVMNSNQIFWPLAAGKTIDDPLYFLKTFKENLRGWLIFGNVQRADYAVLLGTKRVLEAEKLLKEDKKDLVNKTLDEASRQFKIALKNIDEASNKKVSLGNSATTMKPRVANLVNFLPTLETEKADEILQKVSELNNKL